MNEGVFITGASGFIGSNLAVRLLKEGYDVRVLVRPNSFHPFLEHLTVERITGDITDRDSLKEAMSGCSYVFHSAASVSFNKYDRERLYHTNVEGTRYALEAALQAGVKRFIHISACAVFGYSMDKGIVLDEDTTYNIPEDSVYAFTKKKAEDEVKSFCDKGLDCVIVNLCTVYGQGDRTLNSGLLVRNIYRGRMKLAPPGGTSFISVDDAVDGLMLTMDRGRSGERYILCSENLEFIELCNIIAESLGVKGVGLKLPSFLRYPIVMASRVLESITNLLNIRFSLITPQIVKEVFGYKYYSSEKARRELGWKPKVGLKEAVKKAFEFYKEEGLI